MATIEVTKDTFIATVEANDTVVFDFWAPWCGPCRYFAPIFEKAAEDHPEIRFAKVNTQHQPELGQALEIQSIPTLMVFKEGVLVFRETGALPAEALEELLAKVQELDMEQVKAEIAEQQSASA